MDDLETTDSDVQSFLEQQSSEGSVAASDESFRLDPASAWRKLGQFQLPSENAWLLKVVQAACAARAFAIDIQQLREETHFEVSGVPNWTSGKVEEVLFQVSESGPSDLQHLSVAIRALAQQSGRDFRLIYSDGVGAEWNGTKFDQAPRPPSPPNFVLVVSNLKRDTKSGFLGVNTNAKRAEFTADVRAKLTDACCFASVPITVDKKDIHKEVFPKSAGVGFPLCTTDQRLKSASEIYKPPFRSGTELRLGCTNSNQPDNTLFHLRFSSTDEKIKNQDYQLGYALVLAQRTTRQFGNERLDTLELSDSYLYWCLDGVVIRKESLELPDRLFSLNIVVNADNLKTDLSGLALIEDEIMSERAFQALQAAKSGLESVQPFVEITQPGKLKGVLGLIGNKWFYLLFLLAPPIFVLALLLGPIIVPVFLGAQLSNLSKLKKEVKELEATLQSAAEGVPFDLQRVMAGKQP